jgi:hypothetical protein
MKNLILIVLFFTTINSFAQSIIPVEQNRYYHINEIEVPDGTYFKDINHLFDAYEGTWAGWDEGKYYELFITKTTDTSTVPRYLPIDELHIKYRITDANGTVLFDTTTLPEDSYYVIKGQYFNEQATHYNLFYTGPNNCIDSGILMVFVYTNQTQLGVQLFPDYGIVSEPCVTEYMFPIDHRLVLTKQ